MIHVDWAIVILCLSSAKKILITVGKNKNGLANFRKWSNPEMQLDNNTQSLFIIISNDCLPIIQYLKTKFDFFLQSLCDLKQLFHVLL